MSNRLPVTLRTADEGRVHAELAAGGLATGLARPHRETNGLWIGWPGTCSEDGGLDPAIATALDDRSMVGVPLSNEEHEHYYTRISNRCLWPLFHGFVERMEFDHASWSEYEKVNRRFADAVLAHANEGDIVFVQDFHLMLVPEMLRRDRPDLRIGFFLHIPFPSSEVYRVLPTRAEVLRGLLGADMLAFHTLDYLRQFRTSVQRVLGVETGSATIPFEDRKVQLLAAPLGICADEWEDRAASDEATKELEQLVHAAEGRRIVLGVDRLDYTKGVPARLQAFRELLRRDPELVERVMMVQIAVPSRVEVEEYRELKRDVDRMAGEINSSFGRPGRQPLHYHFRSVAPEHLSALYRAADVALVTPLRDGLNLVAKEYVASRVDDDGVLVLGEFTGAAWELSEALQVNPYDVDGMVRTLRRALDMPIEEQRARMAPMRERVRSHDVDAWVDRCLGAIRDAVVDPSPSLLDGDERAAWLRRWREAEQRWVLLDYDGTLREFTEQPEDAAPDEEIRGLLRSLVDAPGVEPWLVSGRSHGDLERWFGDLGLGLIGEHGAMMRAPGDALFTPTFELPDESWRAGVQSVMKTFTERVPGSLIERKAYSIAWHYRACDPSIAAWQAAELALHLSEVLANQPLEVMRGNKLVEVRPQNIDKGQAAFTLLREVDSARAVVFAAGDDRTDEDLFKRLPQGAMSVLVGQRSSAARHRVASPVQLRQLLRELVAVVYETDRSDSAMRRPV